jgi:hypothetical protein
MDADKIVVYTEKNLVKISAGKFGMIEKIDLYEKDADYYVLLDKMLTILGWKITEKDELMKVITYERKKKA